MYSQLYSLQQITRSISRKRPCPDPFPRKDFQRRRIKPQNGYQGILDNHSTNQSRDAGGMGTESKSLLQPNAESQSVERVSLP